MKTDWDIRTRQSLVERLSHWSDQLAWEDFFNRYWKLIYSTALRAGLSDTEAQDVVQQTVLGVAKEIGRFTYDPNLCSFKTWLMRITRWRILTQVQRKQRERKHLHNLRESGDAEGSIGVGAKPEVDWEDLWEAEWKRHVYEIVLQEVKRKVGPQQIQIFDLYVNAEWPAQKVAQSLGISLAKVYLAKHRIARLLKKEVEKLERGGC